MNTPTRRLAQILTSAALAAAALVGAAPADAATTPLVYGHRAARVSTITENSKDALTYARHQGAHGVEVDFRLTSDGRWVLMHDPTLDRTTKCSGLVSSKTLAQVSRCRPNKGSRIPELGEVARWAARWHMTIDADVKDTLTPAQAKAFASTVARNGGTRWFEVGGNGNGAALGAQGMTVNYFGDAGVPAKRGVHVKVNAETVTAARVKALHDAGDKVETYGPITKAKAKALGVDAVMVDDPKAWR